MKFLLEHYPNTSKCEAKAVFVRGGGIPTILRNGGDKHQFGDVVSDEIIKFLRKREYKHIKELGQGGCGKTVLLLDDVIDEHFVCKKYAPCDSLLKEELFKNFANEIKLMHRLFHKNIVRIFNYYLYPGELAGFIIMEYVEGENIDKYVRDHPNTLSAIFQQTIDAFSYLEECGILHRDIRSANILVKNDGTVKVIDLGFGKKIARSTDYQKSISLNWAYSPPNEFEQGEYDFQTEVYFVGQLFRQIMDKSAIEDENLASIVAEMCARNKTKRLRSFTAVKARLDRAMLSDADFNDLEMESYRDFADQLMAGLKKIESKATPLSDVQQVIARLEIVRKNSMLEHAAPVKAVIPCFFLDGSYWIRSNQEISAVTLATFLNLLRRKGPEEQRIILANLFARFDSVERYDEDEIPF